MALQDFTVVRAHDGDRWYDVGDTRTADPAEVAHLVPHVLIEVAAAKPKSTKAAKA